MRLLWSKLAVVMALSGPALAGELIPVDDSYTISQRYERYKNEFAGITWPVSTFQTGQQVLFDRRYKSVGARELHIDVFLPAPEVKTGKGIVLVHGGGWRSGGKSHFYGLANRLAQKGYAVFLPEFRLSPEAPYPAGLMDVNDALVWVKSQADTFGIDRDKLAIGGASSGGQMAALLAYTADKPLFKTTPGDDTRVSALIDIDGVLDFTTPLALQFENAAGKSSAAGLWLGGAMEDVPDRWREASAAQHAGPQSPPTLVISSGIPRFTAGREIVEAKLKAQAVKYRYTAFENAPHDIWLFDPWFGQIVDQIDSFLTEQ
ncbi:alpha/beta hydrolase [Asticcacaulis sp. SL142]|uniref:alpha/beta hydrolase n=1 Tax=Asticcacaulis sp. SL142 TaxID=2995155 RepID=UPI00226D32B4|nr:alpha/beta hydrolase [Asticcacaulis sp. SL142]WAC48397.1 alpha/beta hydrolase [Asticcacaulis sp. SL142]